LPVSGLHQAVATSYSPFKKACIHYTEVFFVPTGQNTNQKTMHVSTLSLGLPLLSLAGLATSQGASGSGQTTRYWDCCKPSCGWTQKTNSGKLIGTCSKSDQPLNDNGATRSGCDSGGSAFMCSNQSPWAINETVSYGWAAVRISGQTETTWCCACYELTFTSGPVAGKKMIVQASNTGGDLGQNHFDLAVGLFALLLTATTLRNFLLLPCICYALPFLPAPEHIRLLSPI